MKKKRFFEDFFLISLILLNIFDFFKVLPESFDFLKKLISWSLMLYLLYHLGFTNILIGYKHKATDIALLVSYVVFIGKDVLTFLLNADLPNTLFWENVYRTALIHKDQIFIWMFNLSGVIMLTITVFLTYIFHIEEKSMLGALNIANKNRVIKFIGIFLALNFVSYFIFGMVFHWFTIIIDAPLIMIAIIYYLFGSRYHGMDSFLHKISHFGDKFIEKFIALFHERSTIPLGLTCLLLLHIFTDVFVFIIPSIIPIQDKLLMNLMGRDIQNIFLLFLTNIEGNGLFTSISLAAIYIANIFFALSLFVLPAIIFKSLYTKKTLNFTRMWDYIIIPVYAIYLIFPVYIFKSIKSSEMSGVNIALQTISSKFITYAIPIIILTVLILFFVKEKHLSLITLLIIQVPLIIYVHKYFASTVSYYVNILKTIMSVQHVLIITSMFTFLLLTIVFYWPAIILYIYEIIKNNHIHLLPENINKEKIHDLAYFSMFVAFMYLIIYYISIAFYMFIININFVIPIGISLLLIVLPREITWFRKIDWELNANILNYFLSILIGMVCGLAFVFFREPLVSVSKNLFLLIIFLIFVAISEELLFRHYLQSYLEDLMRFKYAAIIQATVFTALHINKGISIQLGLSLFAFGFLMTLIKRYMGLSNAILTHFTANLVLYSYFFYIL